MNTIVVRILAQWFLYGVVCQERNALCREIKNWIPRNYSRWS
jgi:hypothetical protein